MIRVFYSPIGERLAQQAWDRYGAALPEPLRMRISRYRRWEDRQAGLFGKLLLAEGLRRCGRPAHLENLIRDGAGRPFLDGEMDLNISHSGDYAVCAISPAGRVGIDIEKVRSIDVADFQRQMTSDQWEAILASEDRVETFFRLWTQKEAVTKADGRGIAIPLETIVLRGGRAFLDDAVWELREVPIAEGYLCHLATDSRDPQIRVEMIPFHQAAR